MITAEQIRAARAMIGLSQDELAAASGLSRDEIGNLERGETGSSVPLRLRQVLESHGIVFLSAGEDDPGVGPGIRLRQGPAEEGMRPENLNADNDG